MKGWILTKRETTVSHEKENNMRFQHYCAFHVQNLWGFTRWHITDDLIKHFYFNNNSNNGCGGTIRALVRTQLNQIQVTSMWFSKNYFIKILIKWIKCTKKNLSAEVHMISLRAPEQKCDNSNFLILRIDLIFLFLTRYLTEYLRRLDCW